VIVRDPSATESSVTMQYRVGGMDDGAHPGLAHLVEHIMFQQQLGGQPVFTHLEDVATYFNATTTFDATTYVARAPTGALGKLLEIEAIRIEERCKTIVDAEFTREREVVVNELAQRDQATEVFRALHAGLFPAGHPYRGSVGGTTDSVRAISRADACAFVDAYYSPQNAVLVVSSPLAESQVQAELARLKINVRAGTVPMHRELATARPQHVEVDAPIDEDVLVVAWPLPLDQELQTKVRAVAGALPKLVDNQIAGLVAPIELGDGGAPLIGLAVLADESETFRSAVDGTRRGVQSLPSAFAENLADDLGDVAFERMKQGALYGLYAGIEDGSDRDTRLASYVQLGRDPRAALAADVRALQAMTREEAAAIARRYLAPNTPIVVTVKASAGRKRGRKLSLRVPVHDFGARRTPVDPALAHRPAPPDSEPTLSGATKRVLPNGLTVVLLPSPSVPTLEARLTFRAGTADEPYDRRGVALIAAHTLTWDLRNVRDALAFVRAGGLRDVDVSTDRTTFSVHGLDTNLDLLLAGLRRWVCDGVYDDSAADFVSVLKRATKRVDDQGLLTDAWRASLFGTNHPYVAAGIARHASKVVSLEDATAYRKAYFTPDNATLVIAGHFDRALIDRWIDYLFSTWNGHAVGHREIRSQSQPASLAQVDDTELVQIRIAVPARAARAQQLVAAEMLAEVAREVRHRLGASYTFDADIVETRAAGFYLIYGWVDASRANAAVELIRGRVEELRKDPDIAARAFIVARAHVLTHLRSRVGSAAMLAARVDHDIELWREPLSELTTVTDVGALKVSDMAGAFAELDLSRATVLMTGPGPAMTSAFKVLGRTPTITQAPPPATPVASVETPTFANYEQRVYRSELTPALTEQPPPRLLLGLTASAAVALTSQVDDLFTGYQFTGTVGYRYGWHNAIGAQLAIGRLSSAALAGGLPSSTTLVPVDVAAVLHLGSAARSWSNVFVGYHFDRSSGTDWRSSTMYGVEGGTDLVNHRGNRIGLAVRGETTSNDQYWALTLGLSYRR